MATVEDMELHLSAETAKRIAQYWMNVTCTRHVTVTDFYHYEEGGIFVISFTEDGGGKGDDHHG